jgi:hypothetical protein
MARINISFFVFSLSCALSMQSEEVFLKKQSSIASKTTQEEDEEGGVETFGDFKKTLDFLFIGFCGENLQKWAKTQQMKLMEEYYHFYWVDSIVSLCQKGLFGSRYLTKIEKIQEIFKKKPILGYVDIEKIDFLISFTDPLTLSRITFNDYKKEHPRDLITREFPFSQGAMTLKDFVAKKYGFEDFHEYTYHYRLWIKEQKPNYKYIKSFLELETEKQPFFKKKFNLTATGKLEKYLQKLDRYNKIIKCFFSKCVLWKHKNEYINSFFEFCRQSLIFSRQCDRFICDLKNALIEDNCKGKILTFSDGLFFVAENARPLHVSLMHTGHENSPVGQANIYDVVKKNELEMLYQNWRPQLLKDPIDTLNRFIEEIIFPKILNEVGIWKTETAFLESRGESYKRYYVLKLDTFQVSPSHEITKSKNIPVYSSLKNGQKYEPHISLIEKDLDQKSKKHEKKLEGVFKSCFQSARTEKNIMNESPKKTLNANFRIYKKEYSLYY